MRIYTCTPVAFGGGPDFFARDSGLLCRGLQSIGVDSRAVMSGAACEEDEADLIRTDYANLESAEWWRTLNLDGIVLYAWGRPAFRKVAKAIRSAGIFLILNQDNGGLVSPLAGMRDWFNEQKIISGLHSDKAGIIRFLKLVVRGTTLGLLATDPLRANHLKQGDIIACVSPKAAAYYRALCNRYGGRSLAERVDVLPHPVETRFRHSGCRKRRQIACVGRWVDSIQKRPELMMEVVSKLVEEDRHTSVVIAGNSTEEMKHWHASLPGTHRNRVDLRGFCSRDELLKIFDESQVFYSPSAFESFGIAAAEALCCGCSVAAEQSVSMVSFEWFVSESSGTLASGGDPAEHVKTIRKELHAWETDTRDPAVISCHWSRLLHADQLANRILTRCEGKNLP